VSCGRFLLKERELTEFQSFRLQSRKNFSSHIIAFLFFIYAFQFQLNATLKEVNHSFIQCIVFKVFAFMRIIDESRDYAK
jgi:hypothetical protein